MTQARRDLHSTEFGIWLREQPEIDSALGYVASNLDYIWSNYKTGDWMLIEEKRHNGEVKFYQKKLFERIHKLCVGSEGYHGFHVLVFQNTSPEDGKIFLDYREITRQGLLDFLRFK